MPQWLHDRAGHLLPKNPKMRKSTAFAIATQQSHRLGKSPKGYGTAEGKREAKAKYDAPKKEYVKTPNPGGLDSPKLKESAVAKVARVLTMRGRKRIKEKSFAIPSGGPSGTGKYPIHDTQHAKSALTYVEQHGSPGEKAQVYAAVAKRYPGLSGRSTVPELQAAKERMKKAAVLPEFLAKPRRGERLEPGSEDFAKNRAFGLALGRGGLPGAVVGGATGGYLGAKHLGAPGLLLGPVAGALGGMAIGTGAAYPFKLREQMADREGAKARYEGYRAKRERAKERKQEKAMKKKAFTLSQYSGDPGGKKYMRYASYIPPFQAPPVKTAGPPVELIKKLSRG